jgi:class 3 adenylate cyclase
MQEIADWLTRLGLPEYAQRFAENGIDFSVLRYLTDQDLEKIGVLLGHRRKMLAAIGELVGSAQAPPQSTLTGSKPQDNAERCQVTVMFSDLVASTALSARKDPEDLREVISAYQKCVAKTVQHFSGFVAKYMGESVTSPSPAVTKSASAYRPAASATATPSPSMVLCLAPPLRAFPAMK